jgi:hypothetical protein
LSHAKVRRGDVVHNTRWIEIQIVENIKHLHAQLEPRSVTSASLAEDQPTLRQCQADYDARHAVPEDDLARPTFKELERREAEVDKCRFVD